MWERGEGRGARGEGQGAGAQACSSARSFHLARAAEVLGAKRVALGDCAVANVHRAHRHGFVQLGVLVVHLERGRLARGGRQECESYAGGCKAAVGQGRVCTGVSEAPSAMWHGVGYRSTHTLVVIDV